MAKHRKHVKAASAASSRRGPSLGLILSLACIIAGISILSVPKIRDIIASQQQDEVIQSMTSTYSPSDTPAAKAARAQAVAYNRALARSYFGSSVDVSDPISSKDDPNVTSSSDVDQEASDDADRISASDILPYDDQLLYADAGDVICWIEIPKISVNLPIYHHTDDTALAMGVGHLDSSSLPVGGNSTHCVLSAHSGMHRERMFDDLRQMEKGDLVALHTLGRTYTYEVYDTETVWPEETQSLTIKPGEDLLTLITCTPYGVNDHRLLVHCRRTGKTIENDPQPQLGDVLHGGGIDWRALLPVSAAAIAAVFITLSATRRTAQLDRKCGLRAYSRRQLRQPKRQKLDKT